jgi:predicted nucleotidyltransferase
MEFSDPISQQPISSPILQQIADKRSQIADLCQRKQVARLELFGSATSDRFNDTTSDLDFLVEFAINTPQGASDRFFGLKQELRDLLGHTIDLIEVQTIKNPYFLEAISSQRLQIYGNQDS